MTTATITPETLKAAIRQHGTEMYESVGVQMHQWAHEGSTISGILLRIDDIQLADKDDPEQKNDARQYVIVEENGAVYTFLQTWELMKRLRTQHIGFYVTVKLTGVKKIPSGDVKLFDVHVSKNRVLTDEQIAGVLESSGYTAAAISDADLPNF